MANRLIKETIRISRNVNALTDFQFRVWIHLITYVDDFGRGSADPELLKNLLFPRRHGITEKQIADALVTLASKGMVILYTSDGEPFFYFPKWSEHQRVRQKVSKFPAPSAECGEMRQDAASCGELPQIAASGGELPQDAAECGLNPIQSNTESNPESRIQNPESKACASAHTHARTRARTREEEQDAAFDAFWAAYPRKSGELKGAYMEWLHALDTGATPEAIMAALEWQAEGWKEEGQPQYIPSPEKWLKNRRWEEKQIQKAKKTSGFTPQHNGPVGPVDMDELKSILERI